MTRRRRRVVRRVSAACAAPHAVASVRSALLALALVVPVSGVVAQQHTVAGDIWNETEGAKIVRAAGATVYLWPERPEVVAAIDSACAASTSDNVAWISARTALEDSSASTYGNAAVLHDLAVLRVLAQLPHATARADTTGHFVISGVPSGWYWIEAESMLDGALVQWWKEVSILNLPISGLASTLSSTVHMGPLEFRHAQFCTRPEPRMGAAAFTDDTPPGSDRVYTASEVDHPAWLRFAGVAPRYPASLRHAGRSGNVTLRFVVDRNGRIDLGTVRVERSTDPDLLDAVRDVLPMMRFVPAQLHGQAVRAWATQPFDFSIRRP